MDIEGAEFVVIPHLIKTGTITLIDELFLESHPWRLPHKSNANKGLYLVRKIRSMGVYAHQWI